MTTRSDVLNDALERLAVFAYLDGPGFACHGAMGAEVLSALGYDELVAGWADEYRRRHDPMPSPPASVPIDLGNRGDFHSALGDMARIEDWRAAFADQLRNHPWPEVVNRWGRRLLVGYAGALTHGLIRVAHGVRALDGCPAPSGLMLEELAKGLALWAASFTILPGQPLLRGPLQLPGALAALHGLGEHRSPMAAGPLGQLDELDDFDAVVASLGPAPPDEDPLSVLSASFCGNMLAHPDDFPVPLAHTVTPVAAVRTLLDHMPDISASDLYGTLWQVGAAITVAFAPNVGVPFRGDIEPPPPSELVWRAAEHGDPHALKFTHACLDEHALSPDPLYLHAADHLLSRVPRWSREPPRSPSKRPDRTGDAPPSDVPTRTDRCLTEAKAS